MLGDYFKQQADLATAQLETTKQIELAKQQYAAEYAKAQMELNKTIVTSTGARFKYFTFIMWFGPFMIGIINPKASHDIFVNLMAMPEWYVQSCMLIMFTVWGISVSAPVVSNIFSGLGTFLEGRRDYKLERAKINRTAYFDELRKLKGGLTQEDVDRENRALDAAEK